MKKHATISKCGQYRYWLERSWAETGRGFVNWIMLNPSIADASIDDPTIRRCIAFSRAWGYDGLHVVNLFALRSPNPSVIRSAGDPVGPENDEYIKASLLSAEISIAAWGEHGATMQRASAVMNLILAYERRGVYVLGLNKSGAPKHPLYVAGSCTPMAWGPPAGRQWKPQHTLEGGGT